MKNNHEKNFKLIKELSELMTKQNITSLEYKVSDIKLKINKLEDENLRIKIQKPEKKDNLSNNQKNDDIDKMEYTPQHPGAIKSPMVGTAYSSPEPGKNPFIKPISFFKASKVMYR